ncbi:MAG: hypothetical protein JJ992_04440 [Planctomycetes bacterium]|nr:hypothetical protein [Planctomycetota bacterium]
MNNPSIARFSPVVVSMLMLLGSELAMAELWTTQDETEFERYAGQTVLEGFEGLPGTPGSEVFRSIPAADLESHFSIDVDPPPLLQIWDDPAHAVEGTKVLFFHSMAPTEGNPARIRFSNFGGTRAGVNGFGISVVDWGSGGGDGVIVFEANNGERHVIATSPPYREDWNRFFFGVTSSTSFTEASLSTTTEGDWILFDGVMFTSAALLPPHESDDVVSGVSFTPVCQGESEGIYVDTDGADNGTVFDPDETMVEILVIDGRAQGDRPDREKKLWVSWSDHGCASPDCITAGNCPSGKLVLRFVDMTTPGFDPGDRSTWLYKTIPAVRLRACLNGAIRRLAGDPPYAQFKAYKTANDARLENQIDVDPVVTMSGVAGGCDDIAFADVDAGIGEVYIQTDFLSTWLDDIVITGKAPNTRLGRDVEVSEAGATITFDEVGEVGVTSVSHYADGPPLPGNFQMCEPPVFVNITTTAAYAGAVHVCLAYPETCGGGGARLLHFEDGTWHDVTTSVATEAGLVCGTVTSLSMFSIGGQATAAHSGVLRWVVMLGLCLLLVGIWRVRTHP